MKKRQLLTYDPSRKAGRQIDKPCSDCPFSRTSLAGWLGSDSPEQWMGHVHGEARVECHVYGDAQCAGAAIYRANVAKKPRDRGALTLPANRAIVFASPAEFLAHHGKRGRKASGR